MNVSDACYSGWNGKVDLAVGNTVMNTDKNSAYKTKESNNAASRILQTMCAAR